VIGPYPKDVRASAPPQTSHDPSRPPDGKADGPRWRLAPADPSGWVNLGAEFSTSDNASAYMMGYVDLPAEQELLLSLKADGLARVWLNDKVVFEHLKPPEMSNRDDLVVRFKKGRNVLVAKVASLGHPFGLLVDVADDPAGIGALLAERESWKEAAAAFARAAARIPEDAGTRYRLAITLLQAGDRDGARRTCAVLLNDHGGRSVREVAAACSLLPDGFSPAEREQVLRNAEAAHVPAQAWTTYVLGLALLRAGDDSQAVLKLTAVLSEGNWPGRIACLPALALAYHRLGDSARARAFLREADAEYGRLRKKPHGGMDWSDWSDFRILHREAQAALKTNRGREPGAGGR
jgi:tetratricopeptide (TPR) repeat protein